jgi:site-specific recombinase XerD
MKGARPLSEDEVAVVAQSFGGRYAARDRALFLLGVKSGFRISELLSLAVGDVHQHGRIVDRVTVARAHMKQKLEGRTVVLHPKAKAALAAWVLELRQHGEVTDETPLFRSRKGNRAMSTVQAWRILQEAYATNGLTGQLGTHAMRKTFANRVYAKLNHDLLRTQWALGHKNINSTVSYLSFCEAEIDAAILAV